MEYLLFASTYTVADQPQPAGRPDQPASPPATPPPPPGSPPLPEPQGRSGLSVPAAVSSVYHAALNLSPWSPRPAVRDEESGPLDPGVGESPEAARRMRRKALSAGGLGVLVLVALFVLVLVWLLQSPGAAVNIVT